MFFSGVPGRGGGGSLAASRDSENASQGCETQPGKAVDRNEQARRARWVAAERTSEMLDPRRADTAGYEQAFRQRSKQQEKGDGSVFEDRHRDADDGGG